ncbi:penicillin-binding protein 1C [Lichenifustis flavocetrariae]|uniref:peptidoglycan glycosyltransferase n=1 Tax=Lichenifustis flavocetrariae TaxID=2949735 RepID=A0AA41YQP9_9HYPH|nr:penicillin-binding protein 1C [Lichenifustis flavocetrariae]MCW6506794.1 penicillin-binding protein 1C [Lichenifustis flavocetrariae]
MRWTGARAWATAAAAGCAIACLPAAMLDRLYPLNFERLRDTSTIVTDRAGLPLRIFTAHDGRWRLPTSPEEVSPRYLDLLLDIEDKRFWHHPGVDPLALMRAARQFLSHGRIVSGGSTLTMQVVRLLEPRPRTFRSKFIEILRALQLEAHCSKAEILRAYLSLAPMGGNLEGLRAGSLAWYGKEPGHVSDAEAALLVLLPQNPNRLRPDRHAAAAIAGRGRLLRRAVADGTFKSEALASVLATPLPSMRHLMPKLAPHLTARLAAATANPAAVIPTTLDAALQTGIESLLAQDLDTLPRPVTLAALVADWRSGEILASIGNAAFGDAGRRGAVDLTNASRSPGSTLKPFIYGLAFEGLLAHPGSLVRDAATRFDDYAPHNFDGTFNGDVTIRQALQLSLNLPAVLTLKRVGPVAFAERLKSAGIPLDFGDTTAIPGLPVALGGAGMTLTHLLEAYAGLAAGGRMQELHDQPGEPTTSASIMTPAAADAVVDILSDMPPPPGTTGRAGRIAYKTGTSYRFRDGWAIGFNGSRVAGLWMGRADGGSCPGCVGAGAAALLFRLFDLMPPDPLPRRTLAPVFAGPPPAALTRLDPGTLIVAEDGPHITFPIAQSKLLADLAPGREGHGSAIKLAATGGERPYRWLVDGRPVDSRPFARDAAWLPTEEGFSTVVVIDAQGRSDHANVRVSARSAN